MYNRSSSSPSIVNTTFSGNDANYGGGMCNSSSSPSITNSIFWDNEKGTTFSRTMAGGALFLHLRLRIVPRSKIAPTAPVRELSIIKIHYS